jgi:predicted metal-binding membrane protein
MAVSLVAGMMDLRAMVAVTLAITAERLLPAGERVARGVGLLAVGAGVLLTVHAVSGGWHLRP